VAEASDNRQPLSKNQLGIAVVVLVVVIAVGLGLYFLLKSPAKHNQGGGPTGNKKWPPISAVFLSPALMRTEPVSDKKHEGFAWAGALAGFRTEFRRTPKGRIYVRYLRHKDRLGQTGDYVVIATYPFTGAVNGLRAQAKAEKAKVRKSHGAFIYVSPTRPRSVYMAFPSFPNGEIEIYAPTPTEAIQLAKSGKIRVQQ
jgi:hypothetical protein